MNRVERCPNPKLAQIARLRKLTNRSASVPSILFWDDRNYFILTMANYKEYHIHMVSPPANVYVGIIRLKILLGSELSPSFICKSKIFLCVIAPRWSWSIFDNDVVRLLLQWFLACLLFQQTKISAMKTLCYDECVAGSQAISEFKVHVSQSVLMILMKNCYRASVMNYHSRNFRK